MIVDTEQAEEEHYDDIEQSMTERDMNDLIDSISIIVHEILHSHPAMYESYDFLDILRKGVFESFEDFVDEDLFHNIFDTQMEMIFNQANLPVRSLKYTYYTLEEKKPHRLFGKYSTTRTTHKRMV